MYNLMVIDDNVEMLNALKLVLEANDYQVLCVQNYQKAHQAITQFAPHLIIVDILLSGFDGRELCKEIKSTQTIPVILMSALWDAGKSAAESNADAFIKKPFDLDELTTLIEKLLTAYYGQLQRSIN